MVVIPSVLLSCRSFRRSPLLAGGLLSLFAVVVLAPLDTRSASEQIQLQPLIDVESVVVRADGRRAVARVVRGNDDGIFVALVAACLLVGKAIGLRNRRRFDDRPVEGGHTKDPRFEPSPFDRTVADIWHETDEFPLTDQNRKQRKVIKERRKAHEIAQKRGKGSD